jgi:hypothetical protein
MTANEQSAFKLRNTISPEEMERILKHGDRVPNELARIESALSQMLSQDDADWWLFESKRCFGNMTAVAYMGQGGIGAIRRVRARAEREATSPIYHLLRIVKGQAISKHSAPKTVISVPRLARVLLTDKLVQIASLIGVGFVIADLACTDQYFLSMSASQLAAHLDEARLVPVANIAGGTLVGIACALYLMVRSHINEVQQLRSDLIARSHRSRVFCRKTGTPLPDDTRF